MDTRTLLEWSQSYLMETYARYPLCLVRGEGVRVWDSDGKEYLDFTAGHVVLGLGHCHPGVVGTIREQAAMLTTVSNLFHSPPGIQLAKLLVEHSFADRVFFSNSGAEANEAALKLARKYAKETFSSDRYEIIATRNSFHGRTLATATATGQEKVWHGFEPLMPGFKHVPFNDLRAVERAMDNRTAAILVEPIQGEGGVMIPDEGYLPGLRKLCDESGALLILDEIQTGMGRTGALWGYQNWGVEPDIMTLAKALANGIPIGATLATRAVSAAFTRGSHGSTFGGNPLAAAVGATTFTTLLEKKLPEHAARTGRVLLDRLEAMRPTHRVIKQVRGKGLLIGIELAGPAAPVITECRERGLLVLPAGDNVVRLAPPLIVDDRDAERALAILDAAFSKGAP